MMQKSGRREKSKLEIIVYGEENHIREIDLTGCPAQAKAMPPQVADTMTTTRSDINL